MNKPDWIQHEWRKSVGILIWNEDRTKILTVTNRQWGGFSCPGGKVEFAEGYENAAHRELLEETGLKADTLKVLGEMPHESVTKDSDPRQWWCRFFEATIGDQVPRQMEEGTVPGWHTPEEMVKTSMYPDFYRRMFTHLGIDYGEA